VSSYHVPTQTKEARNFSKRQAIRSRVGENAPADLIVEARALREEGYLAKSQASFYGQGYGRLFREMRKEVAALDSIITSHFITVH